MSSGKSRAAEKFIQRPLEWLIEKIVDALTVRVPVPVPVKADRQRRRR
ncbi:MAG: hypothetical protein K1X83_01200 [Oligoflexia bacterium]|nr:hypothetical protein [Oligoflexia bacterium]